MDRFVIRTPRQKTQPRVSVAEEKELKQTTILSLKRVVVVEDIKRVKCLLEIENQDKSIILEELDKLNKKIPSRNVLEETKIGLTLNKLRKHTDPEISAAATNIYRCWKNHFKCMQDKPQIEVRFDNDTMKCRESARKLVETSLTPVTDACHLAEAIERCTFELHGNSGSSYRKQMRDMVFTLRHQPDIKERICTKSMTVKDFCNSKFNLKLKQKSKTV